MDRILDEVSQNAEISQVYEDSFKSLMKIWRVGCGESGDLLKNS